MGMKKRRSRCREFLSQLDIVSHFSSPVSTTDNENARAVPAGRPRRFRGFGRDYPPRVSSVCFLAWRRPSRSEEHTSELQSRFDLVCRLLLEKKKKKLKGQQTSLTETATTTRWL